MPHTVTVPYALWLRQELGALAQQYAASRNLRCCLTRGHPPAVCFIGDSERGDHGNFLRESYRAILANPAWRRRLAKPHTNARSSLPQHPEYGKWRELDTSSSSDALLMNIFCCPGVFRDGRVLRLLGVEDRCRADFGVRARVPLASGRFDRTELDMRIGDLLVEAKLTESDFQSKSKAALEQYCSFAEVFDCRALPQTCERYLCYQLIRNVLAAHASGCAFCVLLDVRRPDLLDRWYTVMAAIRIHDLRLRSKVLTWQELAAALPTKLRRFLAEKYGIVAGQTLTREDAKVTKEKPARYASEQDRFAAEHSAVRIRQ